MGVLVFYVVVRKTINGDKEQVLRACVSSPDFNGEQS